MILNNALDAFNPYKLISLIVLCDNVYAYGDCATVHILHLLYLEDICIFYASLKSH